ncbi:MAG TPA: carboxypeptidase-like regulatory domain-containing protein [Terriglobia bacterium]|nr:carboxypeptidase-like regulatory domain-containing protein [Terriglobia bacterium]
MKGKSGRFQHCLWELVCLTALTAGTLFGQGTSGTITGVVADPSGAVVPHASVTITNQATGVKYDLKTNGAGVYFITSVLPGTYSIGVTATGFKSYENHNQALSVDQTLRLDIKLEVGAATQTVTVEAGAPLVNTEAGRMSSLVTATQINNLPLNGRNIYQLMQLVPGAVNSTSVDFESNTGGVQTNINGGRANFNGFLFDGVSNKGLSGGSNAQPSPDFVQEFRIETNNFDAQYSNSAASITDVSTKSGSNQFHGDAYEFFRNDVLNARNFFDGATKSEFRMNQFGATLGGPIKKDKLFFFGGYEGERFRTASPFLQFTESPAFQQAVESAVPNSVAALLYKDFPGPAPTSGLTTVGDLVNADVTGGDIGASLTAPYAGTANLNGDPFLGYLDPCFLNTFVGIGGSANIPSLPGVTWGNPQSFANTAAALFGVTPAQNAQITSNIASACPGSGLVAPAVQAGAISSSAIAEGFANAAGPTRAKGVFYNGDQFVARLDYQGDKNRMFGRGYFLVQKNPNVSPVTGIRGFTAPASFSFPGVAYSWVRSLSPTAVNEFEAGFIRNQSSITPTPSQFGVPNIGFDSGEPSFGAYNGYPQFFNEDVFNFKDMVSLQKSNHSLKVGGELKRNYENSEFDVGRPSYGFADPVFFANDLPYIQAAGVNPELTSGLAAHIDTNIRAWRNYELGFFGQDDWKVTHNLTLNLGLRWDFFSPHTEKYNQATQFVFGPGTDPTSRLASVNCETFTSSGCLLPFGDTNTPNGGFTPASSLFPSRYGNFAPRLGFAWDPFGTGKTSVRGGAAISYEGTFYNALSNSRWNLPFYSFNEACPVFCGIPGLPTYGPTSATGTPTGAAPTFSGAPANIGQGPGGLGFNGNIEGWLSANPDLAVLTGIPSPTYKLPYTEQFFLGIQHQLSNSTVLEVNGVGTLSRHLFWAEDPNRVVGGKQRPVGTVFDPCTGTFDTAVTPTINPCFGHLRTWETSVNSSYWALQATLNRKFSRGLAFQTAYTWSHSIDLRSSWHALTSGGSATDNNGVGESGYSSDPNNLQLEQASSLFDIRHRLVSSIEWDLPWDKSQQGFAGHVLGGWTTNAVISLQSGFPFTVGASKDFSGTGIRAQRPDTPSFGNSKSFSPSDFEAGSAGSSGLSVFQALGPAGGSTCATAATTGCLGAFPIPVPGTVGNLGRNTFRGPGFAETDFSLFKRVNFSSNEARYFEFRAEFFNLFNRTNLNPPVANLTSGSFGLATSASDPREIQFGLKLYF